MRVRSVAFLWRLPSSFTIVNNLLSYIPGRNPSRDINERPMILYTYRIIFLLAISLFVLQLPITQAASEKTGTPTVSPVKSSSISKPKPSGASPTSIRSSSPQKRIPATSNKPGYCCTEGKVTKSTETNCTRKRGQFFRDQRSAQKSCDSQKGYCCKKGEVTKSSRGTCKRSRGEFFVKQSEAKQTCANTKGYCCDQGTVAAVSKGSCERKKGKFFVKKSVAEKQCAKQKGHCCKDGKVSQSTQGICAKQRGSFFLSKREGDQECKKQKGYCCVDGKVSRMNLGNCSQKKGQFFLRQQLADRACKAERGTCQVKGKLLSNKTENECKKLRGTFTNKQQERLSKRVNQPAKGSCCVNGKLLSNKSETECKKAKGTYYNKKQSRKAKSLCQATGFCNSKGKTTRQTEKSCVKLGGKFFVTRSEALMVRNKKEINPGLRKIKKVEGPQPGTIAASARMISPLKGATVKVYTSQLRLAGTGSSAPQRSGTTARPSKMSPIGRMGIQNKGTFLEVRTPSLRLVGTGNMANSEGSNFRGVTTGAVRKIQASAPALQNRNRIVDIEGSKGSVAATPRVIRTQTLQLTGLNSTSSNDGEGKEPDNPRVIRTQALQLTGVKGNKNTK